MRCCIVASGRPLEQSSWAVCEAVNPQFEPKESQKSEFVKMKCGEDEEPPPAPLHWEQRQLVEVRNAEALRLEVPIDSE